MRECCHQPLRSLRQHTHTHTSRMLHKEKNVQSKLESVLNDRPVYFCFPWSHQLYQFPLCDEAAALRRLTRTVSWDTPVCLMSSYCAAQFLHVRGVNNVI